MAKKTNAATKTAEQAEKPAKAKKVLAEKDVLVGGKPMPTEKELKAQAEKELREEAKASGAPRIAAVEATKREKAGLAKGLDGRNAPHSAKCVADDRAKSRANNKADKAAEKAKAKAEKKAARVAERKAKAAPKADDTRKITIVDKKFTFGREGTARNMSWIACTKSKTVSAYAKAGGALKYLPRWEAAGAIKLG